MKFTSALLLALSSSTPAAVFAAKATYKGTIAFANMSPENGTCVTPVWVGIHDGTFDTYNGDEPLPDFMEGLVEDGNAADLVAEFDAANGTVWDASVGEMPICPGEDASIEFEFQGAIGTPYYFSYAAMILPSNDAWFGNGNPEAYEIVNAEGEFVDTVITIAGADVLDAGTEVNDELAETTAFLGQMEPNTGDDENGVVIAHPGFNAAGTGGILDAFPGADFTADGYQVGTITIEGEKVDDEGGAPTSAPPPETSSAMSAGFKMIAVVSSISLFALA